MIAKLAGTAIASLIAVSWAAAADVAAIVDSGSTNRAGFRIVVEQSGDAEFTAAPRRLGPPSGETPATVRRKLPDTLVKRLYSDLDEAKPLSSLPNQPCFKSVSFGSKLTIEWGSQKTPDLSCGAGDNAKLQALIRDANEIVKLLSSN